MSQETASAAPLSSGAQSDSALSSPAAEPPLSVVVSNSSNGRLAALDLFRRYAGSLEVSFQINGMPDVSHKQIVYQCGARALRARDVLRPIDAEELKFAQTIRTSDVILTELIGIQKKVTASTPSFATMDLSAMGYQLGAALAWYVQTGQMSCMTIRANQLLNVRSTSVIDCPMNPSAGHVFIARNVDEYIPGVFAVLTAAANAQKSVVFTDVLQVNQRNEPIMVEPVNAACAMAIYGAMRILLSMYESMGHGTDMAYAIVKGIHSVVTVVAHSNEGGFMRDVIRAGEFRKPYGGILKFNVDNYLGLPAPTATSESTFAALVDSIALSTAALSALADPLVSVEGRYYPTVFTDEQQALVDAGEHVDGDGNSSARLSAQIALECGQYCKNYLALLGKLFMTSGGSVALNMRLAEFAICSGQDFRHLNYTQVAPYYWIEPTSLFEHVWDCVANSHGYGVIAGQTQFTSKPYFEQFSVVQDVSQQYMLVASHRTMRTNATYIALAQHRLDGLAHIVPTQFLSDKALLKGGANTFAAARAAGNDIGMYNWTPRQCPIPHPAAFMYTGGKIGFRVENRAYDPAAFTFTVNHVPQTRDLQGAISFKAARPFRLINGGLGDVERAARRARTNASRALTNARSTWHSMGVTGGEKFAIGDIEPVEWRDNDVVEIGGGDMYRDENVRQLAEAHVLRGQPMPHVIHQLPDRFKPVVPRGIAPPGGGAAPRRAPPGGGGGGGGGGGPGQGGGPGGPNPVAPPPNAPPAAPVPPANAGAPVLVPPNNPAQPAAEDAVDAGQVEAGLQQQAVGANAAPLQV